MRKVCCRYAVSSSLRSSHVSHVSRLSLCQQIPIHYHHDGRATEVIRGIKGRRYITSSREYRYQKGKNVIHRNLNTTQDVFRATGAEEALLCRRPNSLLSKSHSHPLRRAFNTWSCLQGPPAPPRRPPGPPRPSMAGGGARRVASPSRREVFDDEDLGLTTVAIREQQEREMREKAVEAQRREYAAREKQRRLEENYTFRSKVMDELVQRSSKFDSFLNSFKDEIQQTLMKAREDDHNNAAWQCYYTAHIEPLHHILSLIEEDISIVANQIDHKRREIQYVTAWWKWRNTTLAQQARRALSIELEEKGPVHSARSDLTQHHQQRVSLAAALGRLIEIASHISQPWLAAWIRREATSSNPSKLLPAIQAISKIWLELYDTDNLAIFGHDYRAMCRVASISAHFPETAYEIFICEGKALLNNTSNSLQLLNNVVEHYSDVWRDSSKGTAWIPLKEALRPRELRHLRPPHAWLDDLSPHGLSMCNPLLKSEFGLNLCSLLQPFYKYTDSIDSVRVPIYQLAEAADDPALAETLNSLLGEILVVKRALLNDIRVLRFSWMQGLLSFDQCGIDKDSLARARTRFVQSRTGRRKFEELGSRRFEREPPEQTKDTNIVDTAFSPIYASGKPKVSRTKSTLNRSISNFNVSTKSSNAQNDTAMVKAGNKIVTQRPTLSRRTRRKIKTGPVQSVIHRSSKAKQSKC